MRWLDKHAGSWLCRLLTVLRALNVFRSSTLPPIRKIVFVKPAEQGSTVLAYPAIRRAVEWVGRENVYFLVFQENRFILDTLGVIPPENVFALRTKSLGSFVWSALVALQRIRALKIDTAIDLEFFARSSAILAYMTGAPRRVGLHAYADEAGTRGNLLTHRVQYNPYLHTSQTFLTLVEAAQRDPRAFPQSDRTPPQIDESQGPEFAATDDETRTVRATLLKELNTAEVPPLVLLNANCSDLLPLRKWADANYVALAKKLLDQRPDLCIAFTGAPDEAPGVAKLIAQIASPRCISMAGKTSLRGLLALYCQAEVLVTNDSGPAHFATLTPVDVVTLFGPETPALFGARSPRNHVLWAGLICSPCVSAYNHRVSPCSNNLCMQSIFVDQVYDTVMHCLAQRRAPVAS
jgi:ADP-heptose:LPS heptosyltransferase